METKLPKYASWMKITTCYDMKEEFVVKSEQTHFDSLHTIQRRLYAKIKSITTRFGYRELVTNGNLASVLQDMAGYTLNPQGMPLNIVNGQKYPMGTIGNIQIIVDPYMRWDDTRILFDPGKALRLQKLKKISGMEYSDVVTELVIRDDNQLLI